jgi:hypothetical protein
MLFEGQADKESVCAVLVTLLLKDGSQQHWPTQTQPALATSMACKAF